MSKAISSVLRSLLVIASYSWALIGAWLPMTRLWASLIQVRSVESFQFQLLPSVIQLWEQWQLGDGFGVPFLEGGRYGKNMDIGQTKCWVLQPKNVSSTSWICWSCCSSYEMILYSYASRCFKHHLVWILRFLWLGWRFHTAPGGKTAMTWSSLGPNVSGRVQWEHLKLEDSPIT